MSKKHPILEWIPGFWAKNDVARTWLASTGWKVGKNRAQRGKSDIPAPGGKGRHADLYDLHDVSCVDGVGASETVRRIREFAGDHAAAGGGNT